MEHNDYSIEFALLDGKANRYGIYQLKDDDRLHGYKFVNYDFLKKHNMTIDKYNYDFVYADIYKGETLESIYEKFNLNHPKDFKGHSLSVSDIVVLNKGGKLTAHYVDSFGFKEVPEFAKDLSQFSAKRRLSQNAGENFERFRLEQLKKSKEEIFADAFKIDFYSTLHDFFLEEADLKPDLLKFLNADGDKILDRVYRDYLDLPSASINSEQDIKDLLTCYKGFNQNDSEDDQQM